MATSTLSQKERQKAVSDEDIYDIADEVGSEWMKVVRRLPDHTTGQLAFRLNDPRLIKIQKTYQNDDTECMVQALSLWRSMSGLHLWGPLWDTLHKQNYGAIADSVIRTSRAAEKPPEPRLDETVAKASSEGGGEKGEKLLKQGNLIFLKISKQLDYDDLIGLASCLLEDVERGGLNFVKNQYMPGSVPNISMITQAVLEKWCKEKPRECTGKNLYKALLEVNKAVALDFEETLCPATKSQ